MSMHYIKLAVSVVLSSILLQSIGIAADQSTTSYSILTNHVLLPPGGDRANAFHMVVIGDSIAWGNGLNDQDKCYYLVADWLQKKLNNPVDVKVYAHSGAHISGTTGNAIDPDLNSATPTIMDQANNIRDKEDVDLIWVSGGINDIDIMKVIDVNTPAAEIQRKSESIEGTMETLLMNLLEDNINARIIVSNYYPLISYDTKDKYITSVVSMAVQIMNGLENLKEDSKEKSIASTAKDAVLPIANNINYKCRLIENSYTFNYASTNSLIRAIDSSDNGANRIAFAMVNFPPNRCYGTGTSWLWTLQSEIPPVTDDDQYSNRTSLCDATSVIGTLDTLNIDNYVNRINAMGHPNREGAKEYARAIESAIQEMGQSWLSNNPQINMSSVQETEVSSADVAIEIGSSGSLLQQLNHSGRVWSVAFSPDGSKLATTSKDGAISIWDVAHGTKLQTLMKDESYYINDHRGGTLAFSPDGSKLAIGVTDSNARINIYDVNSGEKLQWIGHAASVLAFRPDGKELVTSDGSNTIYIWDVARGTNKQSLETESRCGHSFSPDGSKLATCNDEDRTSRIWDVTSGNMSQEILHNHPAWYPVFNFDGSKLAVIIHVDDESRIEIWSLNSGSRLNEIDSGKSVSALALSSNGSKVASYHNYPDWNNPKETQPPDTIEIWDATSGKKMQEFDLESHLCDSYDGLARFQNAIAFSPDGSKLAVGGEDGYARIYEV